jgi:hypothetical protein
VALFDGAGGVLATTYLTGIGLGPRISFLPAAKTILRSGLLYPGDPNDADDCRLKCDAFRACAGLRANLHRILKG